jgi:hypothetical protein
VLLDKSKLLPSPWNEPENEPDKFEFALVETIAPDAVIWFKTALLPDTMTFFQFGILLFIVVGYSIWAHFPLGPTIPI